MQHVYQVIAEKMSSMSKSHVRIAQYILNNTNTAPFLTVEKLANLAGVSDATIVRFATFLGYSGYPQMQQYMRESAQKQLTTVERLRISKQVYNEAEKGVYEIFQDDMQNIRSTMEKLDMEEFHRAVEALLSAKRIFIIANRSARSLGVFLHYYLNIILNNSTLLETLENSSEQLFDFNADDCIVGISFERYSKSTIQSFAYAHRKGMPTIAITDELLSPLVPHADITLLGVSRMPSFIDSFVAPLSLINALITAVGKAKQEDVMERLEGLEEIWSRFDIFYK